LIPDTTGDGLVTARAKYWSLDGSQETRKDEGFHIEGTIRGDQGFRVYLGPIDFFGVFRNGDYADLGKYNLDSVSDLSSGLLSPLSRLILQLFRAIGSVIPNYGIVIILFSLLMKLIFWPLSIRSLRSMRRMQDLKPKVDKVREWYKDDPKKMQEETLKVYQENKVNPVSGCLPLLIQLPIFWSLWTVLRNSIELRGAPFLLWINDLSQPDMLFAIAGFPIRFLPLAMLVTSVFHARMQPTQAAGGSKYFAYFFPLLMVVIFWNFPSGMVLYWLCYNIYGLFEQLWLRRTHESHQGG
jgi:YidC/Oxa1 family membrane protein insertase